MRSEDVQRGMLVKVQRGSRVADLLDRIGIVRQRVWNHSYSPFEVHFEGIENKQLAFLWAVEYIGAGTFTATGHGQTDVVLSAPPQSRDYPTFLVTEQSATGGTAPSNKVVLKGEAQ
jgi:hypothetical protein